MNPSNSTPGDEPKRDQNDKSGGSSDINPSAASAEQSASSQQPIKAKPKTLQEEIREILYAKASRAARSLKPLGLPESSLEKAAQSIATRAAAQLLAAAMKYARKCAGAEKFAETDLLNEILTQHGIATKKTHRTSSEKKNPRDRPKGDKNAG